MSDSGSFASCKANLLGAISLSVAGSLNPDVANRHSFDGFGPGTVSGLAVAPHLDVVDGRRA